MAEDEKIRLPVIVNLDGFYLSFTREPVELPDKEAVDAFLPPFDAENIKLRASMPESQAVAVLGGSPYSYFRYEMHLAAMNGLNVYERVAADFKKHFGREYASVESYRADDAEYLFVMMGSFATKAKEAVNRLRDAGWAIGLLRPRLFRPFPAPTFQKLCRGKKAVAVIDQNLSMGKGGILHAALKSFLRWPMLSSALLKRVLHHRQDYSIPMKSSERSENFKLLPTLSAANWEVCDE